YCPDNMVGPPQLCPAGYYCPTPAQEIVCPSGYYCREGSVKPSGKEEEDLLLLQFCVHLERLISACRLLDLHSLSSWNKDSKSQLRWLHIRCSCRCPLYFNLVHLESTQKLVQSKERTSEANACRRSRYQCIHHC